MTGSEGMRKDRRTSEVEGGSEGDEAIGGGKGSGGD